jgi:NTP pyrophosphatase (non-canonical NTP hydrolase)
MPDDDTTILSLRQRIDAFVAERDWGQFHNAKDLAAAIAIEAAELMELFLWKTPREVADASRQPATRQRIEEELADVLILCLSLANRLEIDLSAAVLSKVAANGVKYPAARVRGRADKYTSYLTEEAEMP